MNDYWIENLKRVVQRRLVLQILEVDDRDGGVGLPQEHRIGAVHAEADPGQASANFVPESRRGYQH